MFDNYIEPNSLILSLDEPPAGDELLQLEGVRSVEQIGPYRSPASGTTVRKSTTWRVSRHQRGTRLGADGTGSREKLAGCGIARLSGKAGKNALKKDVIK